MPDDLFKFIPDEMAENIRKVNADHEELKLKNLLNVLPLDIFSETYKELEKDLKYSSDYHPVSAISGEYVGKIIKAYLAWEISKDINKEPVAETSNYSRFSDLEITKLKKAVIDEGQALKDMGLTNKELGPAIAGAYDKSTGKIYTAINDLNGDIPTELSPFIKERIENMPLEVFDSYIQTKGAGSHAEVYAVNKLLLDNPNARMEDICVYVNRTLGKSTPVTENPFVTCPHCRYILEGLEIISNK